jgi:Flp pilus assembly protein TadG
VRLARFRRDDRGVAAVEFAFVGAILCVVMGGMLSAWSAVTAVTDLKSAVKAGAAYVMNGGTDDAQTQAISLAAWARRPSDGAVSVTRACTCAGAGHACTTLCGDGSVPMSFVTIRASTAADGIFAQFPLHEQQVVRVR